MREDSKDIISKHFKPHRNYKIGFRLNEINFDKYGKGIWETATILFYCIFKKGRLFQMVYLRQKSLIQVDGNTFK